MFPAVNSVSSMSWYNISAMNDMKLAQALANRPAASLPSGSGISNSTNPTKYNALSFLKDYQSQMDRLDAAAKELMTENRNNVFDTTGAATSDRSVASASGTSSLDRGESYTVEVEQVATQQVNQSMALYAKARPTVSGGSFQMETQYGTYEFDVDASRAENNEEMLTAIADEINQLDTGVTASVVRDGSKISLSLTSDSTGTDASFSVSGSFAEKLGLDNTLESPQDAVYSVRKNGSSQAEQFTSSSNTVKLDDKAEITLQGKGTATISQGANSQAVADKMQELVNRYNETLHFLADNSAFGSGTITQIRRMVQPPISTSSMKTLGIQIQADGTYSFNRDTFLEKMDSDPSLVRDLVGGQNGLAAGLHRDAQSGKTMNTAALLNQQTVNSKNNASNNALDLLNTNRNYINMMNSYTKSGVYNLSNYYVVGTLLNMSF